MSRIKWVFAKMRQCEDALGEETEFPGHFRSLTEFGNEVNTVFLSPTCQNDKGRRIFTPCPTQEAARRSLALSGQTRGFSEVAHIQFFAQSIGISPALRIGAHINFYAGS